MNNIYADAFSDIDDLFSMVEPPARTTFVANPVTVIKDKIATILLRKSSRYNRSYDD